MHFTRYNLVVENLLNLESLNPVLHDMIVCFGCELQPGALPIDHIITPRIAAQPSDTPR